MPPKIISKNSVVALKSPLLADLEVGEIAINRNETSPGLYIRVGTAGAQPTDKVVRIGPVVIGSSAPVFTGGTGYHSGALWFKSDTERLNIHNGTSWVAIRSKTATVGATPPAGAEDGDLWFDTDIAALKVYVAASTVWVEVTSGTATTAYYGAATPEHATESLTLVSFAVAAANGEYIGVKDFRDIAPVTGTSQITPIASYGDPAAGETTWQDGTVFNKPGTTWYVWRRAGFWYIADATTTAAGWYRSSTGSSAQPNLVAQWIALTGSETEPPKSGTNANGVTVQRTSGLVPAVGEVWFDTDLEGFRVWTGASWGLAGPGREEFESVLEVVDWATPVLAGSASFNFPTAAVGVSAQAINTVQSPVAGLTESYAEGGLTARGLRILTDGLYLLDLKGIFTVTGATTDKYVAISVTNPDSLPNVQTFNSILFYTGATRQGQVYLGTIDSGAVVSVQILGDNSTSRNCTLSSCDLKIIRLSRIA